jgi:MSHA biogenesis protein MshJ
MTPLPLPLTRAWAQAARRFDQRARRERVLLTLGAAALLIWAIDGVWIEGRRLQLVQVRQQAASTMASQASLQDGALQLQRLVQAQQQQAQVDIDQLRAQLAQAAPLLAGSAPSPIDPALEHSSKAGARPSSSLTAGTSAAASTQVARVAGASATLPGLVTPQQMLPLLEELLCRQQGLRLRSLQAQGRTSQASLVNPAQASATSAAQATPTAGASGASTATVALYRHGVELAVEGSYADLLAYLRTLEALPQKLLWGPLTLDVEQHPRVVLKLEVYTLSMQPAWVEL